MTQALTGGNAAGGAAAQTNAMMKGMKYIFPVMIVWMARTYPAGLSIYWFVSQIIQIFINLRLNSIRKKIRADKENKKKRSFKRKMVLGITPNTKFVYKNKNSYSDTLSKKAII